MWSSSDIEVPRKLKKTKTHWVWTSLSSGHIEINVDRSFLGSSRRGGTEGIFTDSDGKLLLQFEMEVRVESTVYAKLLAYMEEIMLSWMDLFVFESYSTSVV